MKVFRYFEKSLKECVLTIGNYDGIHLGHQTLINHVISESRSLQVESALITFEPHPKEFFSPEKAPQRVISLREKLEFFQAHRIDRVYVIKFNKKFSKLTASEFIDILKLKVKAIDLVVGSDFRYGKQGSLLDIDHGTYPYVTSSNCVAGQASSGAGVGPNLLHYILGITKAYTTRVGGGPFPSELDIDDESSPGYQMSTKGREFGTVTQRKRRCGWFDAAALKRSAMINGLSALCITKLDVLDGIENLKICVGYHINGERHDLLPLGADQVAHCQPILEDMPGWQESTFGVNDWNALPKNAQNYLLKLEELCGVPLHIISTGPERDETILLHHPFSND